MLDKSAHFEKGRERKENEKKKRGVLKIWAEQMREIEILKTKERG